MSLQLLSQMKLNSINLNIFHLILISIKSNQIRLNVEHFYGIAMEKCRTNGGCKKMNSMFFLFIVVW
jgi:hypothetical protein